MVTALRQLGEKRAGECARQGPAITATDLAQMLADGAHDMNQSLLPLPVDKLLERYRRMLRWFCVDAWWASTMSGRRRQEQAKRMQRTNLAMRWSVLQRVMICYSSGWQTISRIGVDTGRPVAIEKGLLLGVAQPKVVGRLSASPGRLRCVRFRQQPPKRDQRLSTLSGRR
jgi:hypothetical protein